MKKNYLSLMAVSALFPFCANGADIAANELEQKLSEYFADIYPYVEIKENSGVQEAVMPEIETFSIGFDDDGNMKENKSEIPSFVMKVSADGEFKGHPRYKLSTDSVARLQGLFYNSFDIQGIEAASYNENIYFVPALNTVDSHNVAAKDIVQSETDAATGLKNELFRVSNLNMNMDWIPSGEDVSYKVLWRFSGIVFKNPFATLNVPSVSSEMSAVYEDKGTKDYQKLLADISAIKTSESSFAAQGVRVDVMGNPISFDVTSKGNASRDEAAGSISVKAESLVNHINSSALSGFGLREVKVKYLLKNISVEEVKKLAALQEKALEFEAKQAKNTDDESLDNNKLSSEEEALAKEAVAIVDNILKTAEYKMKIGLVFDDADITGLLALKKSDDYVVGNGKITIVNLDKIVPDYAKMCEEEQKSNSGTFPESCMKAGMTEIFRQYIDESKRTTNDKGQTVDEIDIVLNKQGVYVGSEKVTDAVEFNLSRFLAEHLVEQSSAQELSAQKMEMSLGADE